MKYLQILLNQPQGYLFCLIEGPDKESCARVHQEAHGNIACNILEITESDFSALLAGKKKDALDFTLNQDGTLDTGSRGVLAISLLGPPQHYHAAKEIIKQVLDQHEGRKGESLANQLWAVFDSSKSAIEAALTIREKIRENTVPVEIRMGVELGVPLQEKGSFFETAYRAADRFSFIAQHEEIAASANAMECYNGRAITLGDAIKVLRAPDEKFLFKLMDCTEKVWDRSDLDITDFAGELGMSKSQLTRKLQALANISPNDFLKEFRLRKGIDLLKDQSMNVAEVTMAIGFSNPSYFTKCFRKRFGIAPSDYSTVSL